MLDVGKVFTNLTRCSILIPFNCYRDEYIINPHTPELIHEVEMSTAHLHVKLFGKETMVLTTVSHYPHLTWGQLGGQNINDC